MMIHMRETKLANFKYSKKIKILWIKQAAPRFYMLMNYSAKKNHAV